MEKDPSFTGMKMKTRVGSNTQISEVRGRKLRDFLPDGLFSLGKMLHGLLRVEK